MDAQLQSIVGDLEAARRRLHALRSTLSPDAWCRRPGADRWSPAECIAHLNLTSELALPVLRGGLREARARGPRTPARYRRNPIGWMVWKAISPASLLRIRTVPACLPAAPPAAGTLFADFDRLQAEILSCVHGADGLPLDGVTVVSPFDVRLRYNLYTALTLVPRHQHRHLRQAERASQAASVWLRAAEPASVHG